MIYVVQAVNFPLPMSARTQVQREEKLLLLFCVGEQFSCPCVPAVRLYSVYTV